VLFRSRDVIQRHGQAAESAGMPSIGHLFQPMATTFPSMEISFVSIYGNVG
jgi:hypothetical protein